MLLYGDIAGKLSRCELARHEAGHAVTAAVLGWPIEWVGIIEVDGSGEVEPKTGPFFRLDEPLESRRRMVVAMAGSAAQCLAVGCEPQWMPGSEGDKRRAVDYAETTELSPDDFSLARAILSRPDVWEKVDRLTSAMLQCDWLFAWDGLEEFLPDRDPELCEIVGIAAAWDFT